MRDRMIDKKAQALRRDGALNPRPDAVTHELFSESTFFDPRDLVQVKYEMLRCHHHGESVARSAAAFGFSRPSFYQAQDAYEEGGLSGLLPRRRGPRGAHKLTTEIVDFLRQTLRDDARLRGPKLADLVQSQFGIRIHPRTIERALGKKNR